MKAGKEGEILLHCTHGENRSWGVFFTYLNIWGKDRASRARYDHFNALVGTFGRDVRVQWAAPFLASVNDTVWYKHIKRNEPRVKAIETFFISQKEKH